VIARTSSFSFKDRNADIAEIAAKLNVAYVVEGSVRKSGSRLRITAQLVDAAIARTCGPRLTTASCRTHLPCNSISPHGCRRL
jgi:TolB-like protein